MTATDKPVRPGEPGCVLREELYYRLAVVEITQALARAGGNRSEAARQLGIGRAQRYAKLDEHG